jgi:hypothetical protein
VVENLQDSNWEAGLLLEEKLYEPHNVFDNENLLLFELCLTVLSLSCVAPFFSYCLLIMPESPVKTRVIGHMLDTPVKEFRTYLQQNLPWVDNDYDNPANVVAQAPHNGYGIVYVNGPSPKWRWENVSHPTRHRLVAFLDQYDTAQGLGGFTMTRDMNSVTRRMRQKSYYKNQACLLLARTLASNYPGAGYHDVDDLLARGIIAPLDCF